ncbi:MAG: acyl-CoA dehydrogenase family protein [Pseudomonadales bacterium]|jgi:alkylation response protein AidB-like acyl-CoA dehydrogenase|nr:acyl-CoA dehydrogenase family protein [Pseudomonadales bacterium]HJN51879.1 acyl-CoA dehydrogenase family protein [Pseudomonadales bacterium]|tara:strand:+ start:1022 stop:2179 length:1158 start_codon:yes stop_codon:yes gene_type:complete
MAQPRDFGFGADETMIKDAARRFFNDNCDDSTLMALVGGNSDPARAPECLWDKKVWQQVVELGWTAMAVPEDAGGIGMSAVAVAGLVEEAGRAAYPSPLNATINATYVLAACKTDGAIAALREISEGKTVALATTDKQGSWQSADTDVVASGSGKVSLNGTAWFVQDAGKVDSFLVAAASGDGVGLYVIPSDAPGVTIVPDSINDLTRDQAHVEFRSVEVDPACVAAEAGNGDDALDAALPAIHTLTAADMCGAGEWQLQTTAEYARTRVQYEQLIGFFQAVKHPIVDMMIMIDHARSLVYNAACAIDHEPEQSAIFAHMAKASASDMARFASSRSVQFHGGIGYTWECFVHLRFKRQLHNQLLYGDSAYHRAKLADKWMGPIAA